MKRTAIAFSLFAVSLTTSIAASAAQFGTDTDHPAVTRQQAESEVQALHALGYDVNRNDPVYPTRLVAAQRAQAANSGQPAPVSQSRSQVNAEVGALQSTGYEASVNDPNYPARVAAADAQVTRSQHPEIPMVAPLSRAQVAADVAALGSTGYDVNRVGGDSSYPGTVQAASMRVASPGATSVGQASRDESQANAGD